MQRREEVERCRLVEQGKGCGDQRLRGDYDCNVGQDEHRPEHWVGNRAEEGIVYPRGVVDKDSSLNGKLLVYEGK